ncbi:Uncharacterised protein [uncultured archaeon]|nr:Uncharacterised protein [uncultured archaeon]
MEESIITGEADILLNTGMAKEQNGKVRRNCTAKVGLLI